MRSTETPFASTGLPRTMGTTGRWIVIGSPSIIRLAERVRVGTLGRRGLTHRRLAAAAAEQEADQNDRQQSYTHLWSPRVRIELAHQRRSRGSDATRRTRSQASRGRSAGLSPALSIFGSRHGTAPVERAASDIAICIMNIRVEARIRILSRAAGSSQCDEPKGYDQAGCTYCHRRADCSSRKPPRLRGVRIPAFSFGAV